MFQAILGLSPVILLVLALLIAFSIGSWAIVILKSLQIRQINQATRRFTDFFWATKEFKAIQAELPVYEASPLARLFREGYRETEHFLQAGTEAAASGQLTTDLNAIDNISRSLRKVSGVEIEKLEKRVSFLATTASTTPFIGLFGTVWGIMNAFQNIGQAGSTSLAIVAPGISEALVTTAIGLAVAIPAVIGYNFLQSKIRKLTGEIDNFSYDFLNIVQRCKPA